MKSWAEPDGWKLKFASHQKHSSIKSASESSATNRSESRHSSPSPIAPQRSAKLSRSSIARIRCCLAFPDKISAAAPVIPMLPFSSLRSKIWRRLARSRLPVTSRSALGGEIALSPEEAQAKEVIEREFERAGLAVPTFATVLEKVPVEAPRAQKILQILLREKVLIRITEDLVFHRAAVAQLRDLVVKYKQKNGTRLPVPAFKELTGVTRKYAIPLLEYLDREHVTRRVGDERVIL